jgi:glycosyltransferase involved in cell wall biosynthesis
MRILYYGDFGCTTGFGNVSKNLIDEWLKDLGDDDELIILALNNHDDEAYEYGDRAMVIPLLGTREEKDKDPHCRNSFLRFLHAAEYDHVFMLNDLEVLNPLKEHIQKIKKKKKAEKKTKFKLHIYYPIDSKPSKKHLDILTIADKLYSYTEWGKSLTQEFVGRKKIEIVPHGTDGETFYPMDYLPPLFPEDAYVFGCINRNSQRKDIATLLQAFKYLKEQLAETDAHLILYLHMNPMDPFGLRINEACETLDLEIGKDVWLPSNFNENKGFSEEKLNELYNAFDVFVSTTTAEGWGLTITEAMACGTPVICPIHTSLTEITEEGTLVYPLRSLRSFMFVKDIEKVRYISSVKEVAKRMYDAMAEIGTDYQSDLTEKARKKVLKYKWSKSAEIIMKNFK